MERYMRDPFSANKSLCSAAEAAMWNALDLNNIPSHSLGSRPMNEKEAIAVLKALSAMDCFSLLIKDAKPPKHILDRGWSFVWKWMLYVNPESGNLCDPRISHCLVVEVMTRVYLALACSTAGLRAFWAVDDACAILILLWLRLPSTVPRHHLPWLTVAAHALSLNIIGGEDRRGALLLAVRQLLDDGPARVVSVLSEVMQELLDAPTLDLAKVKKLFDTVAHFIQKETRICTDGAVLLPMIRILLRVPYDSTNAELLQVYNTFLGVYRSAISEPFSLAALGKLIDAGLLAIMLHSPLPRYFVEYTDNFIGIYVTPALVYRSFLHIFRRSQQKFNLPTNAPSVFMWNWNVMMATYAHVQGLKEEADRYMESRRYCHARECPTPKDDALKLRYCFCGNVFYCSKTCQARDWEEMHRERCASRREDTSVASRSDSVWLQQITKLHFDRMREQVRDTLLQPAYKDCVDILILVDWTKAYCEVSIKELYGAHSNLFSRILMLQASVRLGSLAISPTLCTMSLDRFLEGTYGPQASDPRPTGSLRASN